MSVDFEQTRPGTKPWQALADLPTAPETRAVAGLTQAQIKQATHDLSQAMHRQ
jgi:hypothetical protein